MLGNSFEHKNPSEHKIAAQKFDASLFASSQAEAATQPEIHTRLRPAKSEAPPLNLEHFPDTQFVKEKLSGEAENKRLARLFNSGNIEAITEFLGGDEKMWSPEFKEKIYELQESLGEKLEAAKLTQKDWGILTAINIFDQGTFQHSVGAFELAQSKIEKEIPDLRADIESEGVSLDQFYRGCLFHDIGKMAIPEFIMNNKTSDAQWVFHFSEIPRETQRSILAKNGLLEEITDELLDDLTALTAYCEKNRIRAVQFVPIREVLSQEKITMLEDRGIDCNNTLGEIMQLHEEKSETFLRALGYGIEAVLAGHHHNYKHIDPEFGETPESFSSLHISSSILHMIDVDHALSHNRPYSSKQPRLRILAFIVDFAEKGKISKKSAVRWVTEGLSKMSPAYLHETRNLLAQRQHHEYLLARQAELEKIEEFLLDNSIEEKKPNSTHHLFGLSPTVH